MFGIGDLAPDFTILNQDGESRSLRDFRGKNLVLYFYPRDNTAGCTTEALGFKEHIEAFKALNTVVVGISKDSIKSHTNFIGKHELPFELLSDKEIEVCHMYGVYQLKKLYGKESMGIVRSTFIIDTEGVVREIYSKVRVKGHVETVLERVKAMS